MKREIGGNIFKFLFFIACAYAIIVLSIWSYHQTQQFFASFDAGIGNSISNAFALLTQYGQNVVLFLASIEAGRRLAYNNKIETIHNRTEINILEEEIKKSENVFRLYWLLFIIFALIDAGTNVGEFFNTTVKTSVLTGTALVIFKISGTMIVIVMVFIEELFMGTVNAILHALNDIFESLGHKRVPSLDLFIDPDKMIAMRLEERNGKRGDSNGGRNDGGRGNNGGSPFNNSPKPPRNFPQSLPRVGGEPKKVDKREDKSFRGMEEKSPPKMTDDEIQKFIDEIE